MSFEDRLRQRAKIVAHWALPEINHCPTQLEFAELVLEFNQAAEMIHDLSRKLAE